jgi:RNase adaptor protein for sRNA GlmZ degradation
MGAKSFLTIHLHSFSFRQGGAPQDPSSHGGGFVFDCRALPNPFWDEVLRPYSGLEPPVVAFMERHPEVREFADHAAGLVIAASRAYAERGFERLMVAFGCTGGRHRSVYLAEQLRQVLEAEGFKVVMTHRDIARDAGNGET